MSVRHLKTSESFHHGFILEETEESLVEKTMKLVEFEAFPRQGGSRDYNASTYPSVEPVKLWILDTTSQMVKIMDRMMAHRRIPKRGERLISSIVPAP